MISRVVNYLISSKEELKKVSWPSQSQTINETLLVVALSLAVAVYLGLLDYFFTFFLDLIL